MMAASADDEPTPITTWQGPAAPHDSILVTTVVVIDDATATSSIVAHESRGASGWLRHCNEITKSWIAAPSRNYKCVRRPGVVGSTTGAGVGLPLLVFVVTLLGLLGYCIAGAAAATENTSSLSSLLPSLGRFTSSPPSPSRYYTNNNDVTSATTRVIGARNSPRGFNNVRAVTSHSLFHHNDEKSSNGADSLLKNLQLRELLSTSIRDKEEEEAARSSSISRTRSIGDPLVIFDKTFYFASTYPESTEYRGQGYTSRSGTDVTENLRCHKLSHSRRGRRRRRRKNVDWEGDIRRKRDDNEIRRNGIDPSRRQSLISSIVWRKSLNIPPTIYDPRDIVNEPNESTRVDVDVDGRTGAALPTSKVAIIEDRGGKKTTRDTEQGTFSNDKENSARVWENRDIGTIGVTVSSSFRDTSVINGKNYFTSKVAATRVVNNHNNDSYTNIINNVNNRNSNHQRKYNNKNSSGSDNVESLSVTKQDPNEDVTTSTVTASSPSESITTELSYGNDESALEWRKSRKIAVPMTARSYPQGVTTGVPGRSRKWPELPVVGNSTEKTTDTLERRITSAKKTNGSVVEAITEEKNDTESTPSAPKNINTTAEETLSTQPPSPTQDTSMEPLSGSGYIVSVVLVLLVGALVGVLATVSHHLHHHRRPLTHTIGEPAPILPDHHRHHHRRRHHRHHHHHHSEETPASLQRRLLLQEHQNYSDTPMLSVSAGMEVGSGGHGGHGGLGGGLVEASPNGGGGGVVGGHGSDGMQEAIVAAARDRAIRAGSVRQDLALDLPPRLQLPDGEERPYGAHTTLHLRDPEQESEIYQKCVRPPPNRTVFDSESPPPYRSHSALLDPPDRIVRCHSAGSSLLRVFRKFPSSGGSTPGVVVPPSRRPTLSSYSESSGNLSNLSSLTVVPCEADETNHHRQHV